MMNIYSASVDFSWDTDNYITFAESKEEALDKIKSSMSKTKWKRFEKRITESLVEEDEVFYIRQSWD